MGTAAVITKVGPERTCAGCGEKAHPAELVRIVLGPRVVLPTDPSRAAKESARDAETHEIAVDPGRGAGGQGRGAHVHPVPSCITAAAQRGLPRSFKSALSMEGERLSPAVLSRAVAEAFGRRAEGLLAAARRARRIALGADSVVAAARSGTAHLVIVATDAASAAELTEVRRAIADGRAVSWSTKDRLSVAAGGSERTMGLGVVAITDDRIARATREAVQVIDAMSASASSQREGARPRGPSAPSSPKMGSSTSAVGSESVTTSLTNDAARVGERRGEATDVNGGTPPPERGPSPSDDGRQAVE